MDIDTILKTLKELSNPHNVEGMTRYGINPENNLGVSVGTLRNLAKTIGHDHTLALSLWDTGIRDARMLAAYIDIPHLVTEEQMEKWVSDFNSWDVCDNCCGHLFDKTKYAYQKAMEWSTRKEEFVKRAGFSLMAWLAVHDKHQNDDVFEQFFPAIIRESSDDRNYVKKAVSWALRQIGKRNQDLHTKVIQIARNLLNNNNKTSQWIGSQVIKKLS